MKRNHEAKWGEIKGVGEEGIGREGKNGKIRPTKSVRWLWK
jgi:hypothetical protein